MEPSTAVRCLPAWHLLFHTRRQLPSVYALACRLVDAPADGDRLKCFAWYALLREALYFAADEENKRELTRLCTAFLDDIRARTPARYLRGVWWQ